MGPELSWEEASQQFACCEPLRIALDQRLRVISDDTILCSTYLAQSDSLQSCYTAVGDERELPMMAEDGDGEWVLAMSRRPKHRIIVEPHLPSCDPGSWPWSYVPFYESESDPYLRIFLKNSSTPLIDPLFPSDQIDLEGSIIRTIPVPLDPAKPLQVAVEKRFTALTRCAPGMDKLDLFAIYLTRFSYGRLVAYDRYHEAIRHCRELLRCTLPRDASLYLKGVVPAHKRAYTIVSKLGTIVEVEGNNRHKGMFVGVLGDTNIAQGLIVDEANEDLAWIVPVETIVL
jgi:hypothetical protein